MGIWLPEQKFFVRVVSTDYQKMLEEQRIITRPENTYVKIPVTPATDTKAQLNEMRRRGLGVLATANLFLQARHFWRP